MSELRQPRIFSEVSERDKPNIRRVFDPKELEGRDDIEDVSVDIREKILWGIYGDFGTLLKITELRDIERLTDSEEDAQAFQKLYLKGLRTEPPSFGSTFEIESQKSQEAVREFLRKNYVVGVKHRYKNQAGEDKDKLVAIAQFTRQEGVRSHIATIGKVYVHPAHRKRFIAQSIMAHLLRHAEEEGVEQVHLIVTASNLFVIEFYKKLGFVPGAMQYRMAKIDDEYYDWLPMKLNMRDYKSSLQGNR